MKNNKLKFDPKNWDWYAYLDASDEVKESYSVEALDLASSWVTCACGQLCDALPKSFNQRPADDHLRYLGEVFMDSIESRAYISAKATLDNIEIRTAYLLTLPNFTDDKDE